MEGGVVRGARLVGGGSGGVAEDSDTEIGSGSIGILTWRGSSARVSLSIHPSTTYVSLRHLLTSGVRKGSGGVSKARVPGTRELPADAVDHSNAQLHTSVNKTGRSPPSVHSPSCT